MVDFVTTEQGRRLAYRLTRGSGPAIVFLGGFKSDMEGSKAVYLEGWAKAHDRTFLRFDYSGHGQSSGAFEEGCIGDWLEDAHAAIDLIDGPVVLVGSSMGGWIALLLARARPEKIAGLVGIAAAPDFTEAGFWAGFDEKQRSALLEEGSVELPSDYDEPYVITRRLIEDGRKNLVLQTPLNLPMPVRLVQGTADSSVPVSWGTGLLDHMNCEDARLTLVKGADHSFSSDECLFVIAAAILELP